MPSPRLQLAPYHLTGPGSRKGRLAGNHLYKLRNLTLLTGRELPAGLPQLRDDVRFSGRLRLRFTQGNHLAAGQHPDVERPAGNKARLAEPVTLEGNLRQRLRQSTVGTVLAGVLARMGGRDSTAAVAGAAGGELAARAIAEVMYPSTPPGKLNESQKQTISALGQLAGGLAGGIASDSLMGSGAGAMASKNAVENNFLHAEQIDDFAEKAKGCEARGDCGKIVKEMENLSLKQQEEMIAVCASNAPACKEKYGNIPANGKLVREAIDRVLGDDVPSKMKNDMSSLLAQQIEAEGVVSSTEFASQLQIRYNIGPQ